ncbi:ATP-binding protein [bacterium]|nr:ATP-binding protein [bacterium]
MLNAQSVSNVENKGNVVNFKSTQQPQGYYTSTAPIGRDYYESQNKVKKPKDKEKILDNVMKIVLTATGIAVLLSLGTRGISRIRMNRASKVAPQETLDDKLKENFTQHSKEMWRDITKEKGLDDLILSKTLKDNAQEIENCVYYSEKLKLMGSEPLFSVLLYGPPGTGKTAYATAIGKKFPGSKFAFLDVGTMKDMYHGGSEMKINAMIDEICMEADKLLKEYKDELAKVIDPKIVENGNKLEIAKAIDEAKKAGKTIPIQKRAFVLADEIDSIMMVDEGNGAKLSNDMLNEFKKGFTDKLGRHENVTVFGCTNLSIDVDAHKVIGGKELDTAMLDRFQLKFEVPNPDKFQIKGFINKHLLNLEGSPYVNPDLIKGAKGENKQYEAAIDKLSEFLTDSNHSSSFRTVTAAVLQKAPRDIVHKDVLLDFMDYINAIESQLNNFHVEKSEFNKFKQEITKILNK